MEPKPCCRGNLLEYFWMRSSNPLLAAVMAGQGYILYISTIPSPTPNDIFAIFLFVLKLAKHFFAKIFMNSLLNN